MKLKDKKPILIIGALIGFLSYLYSIKEDYIINPSQSLPRGIYKLYPPTDIKKGDIVVFGNIWRLTELYEAARIYFK